MVEDFASVDCQLEIAKSWENQRKTKSRSLIKYEPQSQPKKRSLIRLNWGSTSRSILFWDGTKTYEGKSEILGNREPKPTNRFNECCCFCTCVQITVMSASANLAVDLTFKNLLKISLQRSLSEMLNKVATIMTKSLLELRSRTSHCHRTLFSFSPGFLSFFLLGNADSALSTFAPSVRCPQMVWGCVCL